MFAEQMVAVTAAWPPSCPLFRPCVRRLLSKLLIHRVQGSRAPCQDSPPIKPVQGSLHHLPWMRLNAFPEEMTKNRNRSAVEELRVKQAHACNFFNDSCNKTQASLRLLGAKSAKKNPEFYQFLVCFSPFCHADWNCSAPKECLS